MAAHNKTELLEITRLEIDKLKNLIDGVDEAFAMSRDGEDTSIKDVIAHRAHWITLFLGWYADGLAGKPVAFPAPGYKWSELKRYNAALRATQKDMGWSAAQALLLDNAQRLIDFIDASTDKALYSGPMQGAHNDWTPGRWAEAAGPSHFRSAAKYLKTRLKTARTAP